MAYRVFKSRKSRWAGHVARMEEARCGFKILTGKPTGKSSLARPRRRWEDNFRMYLKEMGINAKNWVDSTQDRDYWRALVNAALNLRVPKAMELVNNNNNNNNNNNKTNNNNNNKTRVTDDSCIGITQFDGSRHDAKV